MAKPFPYVLHNFFRERSIDLKEELACASTVTTKDYDMVINKTAISNSVRGYTIDTPIIIPVINTTELRAEYVLLSDLISWELVQDNKTGQRIKKVKNVRARRKGWELYKADSGNYGFNVSNSSQHVQNIQTYVLVDPTKAKLSFSIETYSNGVIPWIERFARYHDGNRQKSNQVWLKVTDDCERLYDGYQILAFYKDGVEISYSIFSKIQNYKPVTLYSYDELIYCLATLPPYVLYKRESLVSTASEYGRDFTNKDVQQLYWDDFGRLENKELGKLLRRKMALKIGL